MQHLLADCQTLPFIQNTKVNLPILKQQIDRRILKIKALLQSTHQKRSSSSSKPQQDKFVQTESTPALFNSLTWQESAVLAPSNKFNPNIEARSSLPIKSAKKNLANQDKENNMKSMKKIVNKLDIEPRKGQNENDEEALLESNGFTFRGQSSNHQMSSFKKNTLVSHGDFDNCSDFVKASHDDLYDSQIQSRFRGRYTLSPLDLVQNNRSEAGRLSMFTDLSSSNRTKTEISHRRLLRTKSKYQQQEIIMPEPQKRILVSHSCLQKMQRQVSTLIPRRRKQFLDTNLRWNVLKRLQQKYNKEIYSN